MPQFGQYPTTFYRVSLKAVIRNNNDQVLCVKEGDRSFWELPGGGIDHGEDVKTALTRELYEEIGYSGTFKYVPIDITTIFDEPGQRCMMNIAFDVVLHDPEAISVGPDASEIKFLDPADFKDANARSERLIYKHAVDHDHLVEFVRKY